MKEEIGNVDIFSIASEVMARDKLHTNLRTTQPN